ncbi:MAG: prephenate dehydratase domain-containing protein, partial [Gammaproteobacteria bacterium]|nr:prephenate dehydratase domain-containing protein [Gammaproteobacteria bacterium]
MVKRIAYLGPAGTFTEDASLRYDPGAERIPFPSIAMIAEAVITGEADEGIAPIENSLEGSVTATLDLLIHGPNLMIL